MSNIEKSILNTGDTNKESLLDEVLFSLKAVRKLQQDGRIHGTNRVNLYFEDVEGDWLDKWDENEDTSPPV